MKKYQRNLAAICAMAAAGLSTQAQPGWVTGDFHQHSTYTDGSWTIGASLGANDYYGLDWWANSEHGGRFNRNGSLSGKDTGVTVYWDETPGVIILGDYSSSGGHQNMWRWQSVRDFSFHDVLAARAMYPGKIIIQGVEWNVPSHEHCSVAIIANQFGEGPLNASPVAEFEYKFDNSDTDKTGGAAQGWIKSVLSGHDKAVEAVAWLGATYPGESWVVFAHPERKKAYKINHFRDFNNAAPTVAFGFESMPGHQRDSDRGGYSTSADGGGTFGGCGVYAAKVGGLWDAMLAEGRGWWLFASSDFHDTGDDYWQGQYQKTHTYVTDRQSPQAIVDGLRSGNSFVVEGDLVNALNFSAQYDDLKATMGQTLVVEPKKGRGNPVKITVKFKSPAFNHAPAPLNNVPVVDHIDLIAGSITGKVDPSDPNYANIVSDAQVIARFTSADWEVDADGWTVMHAFVRLECDTYVRLRGTNTRIGVDTADIDENGHPKNDFDNPLTGDAEAWTDLWFYSNPIFIDVVP